MIAERGVSGTRIADVAKRAGTSPPDELEEGMVALDGTVQARVYLGMNTQVTVGLGDGAHLVAIEQATYHASADDRWEPGTKVRLGWHPEHCLVLR